MKVDIKYFLVVSGHDVQENMIDPMPVSPNVHGWESIEMVEGAKLIQLGKCLKR